MTNPKTTKPTKAPVAPKTKVKPVSKSNKTVKPKTPKNDSSKATKGKLHTHTRESNLTEAETIQLLKDTKDNALEWLAQQVANHNGGGTLSSLTVFERVSEVLESKDGVSAALNNSLPIPGFNPEDLIFAATKEPVDA